MVWIIISGTHGYVMKPWFVLVVLLTGEGNVLWWNFLPYYVDG